MLELAKKSKDWRYCKCGHQPDDHNPISFACFLCDCAKWTADLDKSRLEGEIRLHDEAGMKASGECGVN